MKIDKTTLGLAGEFAVASEMCRRNVYAQLTFGNQKRIDILVYSKGSYAPVEVKCKQGRIWPNCRGIGDARSFLVLVDYCDVPFDTRPGFYVLTYDEWLRLVTRKAAEYQQKWPDRQVIVKDSAMHLLDEVDVKGKHYVGCSIMVSDIAEHKDRWDKIQAVFGTGIGP